MSCASIGMTKNSAMYNCSSVDVCRVSWRRKPYNLKSNAQPPPNHPYASVDTLRSAILSRSRPSYASPAACINSLVNFVRSLVCITVGRLVHPISVGKRSLPVPQHQQTSLLSFQSIKARRDLRNQYSINSLFTVPVVPSAMISKKLAHSPQLKPSASNEVLCCGLVRLDVARRAMRASATC
jgi:hypothetical protein